MAAISAPERAGRGAALLVLLLWPALLNRYPLVFSDTGTYISQIAERHLGWDRPPFYSLFLFLTDKCFSLWGSVFAQAGIVAFVLALYLRFAHARGVPWLLGVAVLVLGTALPFTAAEIMPDVFAPLAVLISFLLIEGEVRGRWARIALGAVGTGCLTLHMTILPAAAAAFCACLAIAPARAAPLLRPACSAAAIAILGFLAVNLLAYGKPALAPYSPTFYLARLIEDGPARDTLLRECPTQAWALCKDIPAIPATADDFLWRADSPLYRNGGPRRLIGDTRAIIRQTLIAEPWAVLYDGARDAARQFLAFRTGDGLKPWPETAGATIARDFPPAQAAAYRHGLQAEGRFAVPAWLAGIQETIGAAGLLVAGMGAILLRDAAGRLCLMAMAAAVANAILTGAFSGPHERYQSRMIWLVVAAALVAAPALFQRLCGSTPASSTT